MAAQQILGLLVEVRILEGEQNAHVDGQHHVSMLRLVNNAGPELQAPVGGEWHVLDNDQ